MRYTKINQKNLYLIISLLFIGLLFLSGCEEKPSKKVKIENRILIKNSNDDGYVAILTNSLPVPFGNITSENEQPLIVGLFPLDSQADVNSMISRGILRFNISEWDNTDITFHLKCINIEGEPGLLEILIIDDLQPLLDFTDMREVSDIWYLLISSNNTVSEVTPKKGKWVDVLISKDIINNLDLEDNYLSIVLKLSVENLTSNKNYYGFATIDYTPLVDNDQPYLIYVED